MITYEPYRGLSPYYEEDADFFCGREDEILKVKNSLEVYPLTVLHGAAGVGKTSFLNAGVAHRLRRDAELNRKRWGFLGCGVAVFPHTENAQAWITKPLTNLTNSIQEQMEKNFGLIVSPFHPKRGLKRYLVDITESLGDITLSSDEPRRIGDLYIIFDQFEAYLQHEEDLLEKDVFFHSFVEICRDVELPVHFLIGLESDAFSKLDRFEGLIPRLLDNRYELGHLDVRAAEQAITEPIHKFNGKRKDLNQPEVSFDSSLVHEILEECVAIEEGRNGSLAGGKIAFDLRLMSSLNDVSDIPTEGKGLIVVAKVNNVLHFRIFDGDGKVVVDTDDKKLPEQRQHIEDLKKLLERLWPRHELSRVDKGPVTLAVKSIVGLAPKIEAPYLQLVMQRLWQEEGIPERSLMLHTDTLNSLGGVKGIIQDHVDQCMSILSETERDMAARTLHQLLVSASPARIEELVKHANEVKKDWQPELLEKSVQDLFEGPLAHKGILRPQAHGEYESSLQTLREPLGDWVRRQQKLDGLSEEIASAEATFERSQLDGLGQAVEAAEFALQEHQQHKVSESRVLTPLLIGSLRRMLHRITESRRITDEESPLNSISYSPDGEGQWFAAASFNGRIHLLNRKNRQKKLIHVRDEAILDVALGPDERIAVASRRGYARILNFDGEVLKQFPDQASRHPCYSVAFSADGKRLATGSMDGVARIWDIDGGQCIPCRGHELTIHSVTFGPNQPIPTLLTASWDGTVRVWDSRTGDSILVCQVAGDKMFLGSISPRGDRVATVSWGNNLVRIWNLSDKSLTKFLEFPTHEKGFVSHICFHDPEGRRLVTVSWDGTARLWDVTQEALRSGFDLQLMVSVSDVGGIPAKGKNLIVVVPVNDAIHFRIFDGDGKMVVDHDEKKLTIQARRMEDLREQLKSLWPPYKLTSSDKDRIIPAIAAIFGHTQESHEFVGHTQKKYHFVPGPISRACLAPDRQELATNQWDGVVHLWTLSEPSRAKDQEDATIVLETPNIPQMSAAFSPDGHKLAAVGFDNIIRLYPVQGDPRGRGIFRSELPEKGSLHQGPLACVAFHPSRTEWLATASYDHTGRLWVRDGNQLVDRACLKGHQAQIFQIAYSPAEEIVVTASMDGTLRFWDLAGEQRQDPFEQCGIAYSAKFHPSGNVVASAWGDGFVRLIDTSGNQIGPAYRIPESSSPAFCVDFSDDGKFLGAVFGNGKACVWECRSSSPDTWLASEPRRPPFQVHEGLALAIAFTPTPGQPASEPWFATSSAEGLVRLWTLYGRKMAEFKVHESFVRSIDFHPEWANLRLLTASVDGTVKLLKIDHSIESLRDLHDRLVSGRD